MAGNNLSPRQKMIGMMYLVLTALLALNISKEIVLAFVLINEGLEVTTENLNKKNKQTYSDFEFQEKQNPGKVRDYRVKALTIKRLSDEMEKYIEDLKKEIMGRADNLSKQKQDTITLEYVESKDENNIPAEIMIGSSSDGSSGKARELKNKINEYKSKIGAILKEVEQKTHIPAKINLGLETKDPALDKEGIKYTWETHFFGHFPLAPVITNLSKLQSDVRNAEADAINFLYSQISARDFKFDTLAAKVIPKSSYVVIGQEYEADVFVAAFSTTQNPQILIGQVDSVKHEMIGKADSITVERGVGKYIVKPTTEGPQKWGGLINVKSPDGTVKSYPFKAEYLSAKPSAVVSPEKMNVLYIGIPNPISVSVSGFAAEKIFPSISSGSLSGSRGKYTANVMTEGDATISVSAETEPGKKQNMGQFKFRVKKLPNPVAKIATKKGGPIGKAILSAQVGIVAEMENFEFEGVNFKVISFDMTIAGKGREPMFSSSRSNSFSSEMLGMFGKLRLADKVYFENIKAIGPGGDTRTLSPVSFVIN